MLNVNLLYKVGITGHMCCDTQAPPLAELFSAGNPLLIRSSLQPDLSVSRTYTSPMCFHDAMDKELLDPLPDLKVKGEPLSFSYRYTKISFEDEYSVTRTH